MEKAQYSQLPRDSVEFITLGTSLQNLKTVQLIFAQTLKC